MRTRRRQPVKIPKHVANCGLVVVARSHRMVIGTSSSFLVFPAKVSHRSCRMFLWDVDRTGSPILIRCRTSFVCASLRLPNSFSSTFLEKQIQLNRKKRGWLWAEEREKIKGGKLSSRVVSVIKVADGLVICPSALRKPIVFRRLERSLVNVNLDLIMIKLDQESLEEVRSYVHV